MPIANKSRKRNEKKQNLFTAMYEYVVDELQVCE